MRMLRFALIGLVTSSLFFVARVYGQTGPTAADLFEQGVNLMNAGRFVDACALIQTSYEREPKDSRLAALAKCRDGEGKLATARELYRTYLEAFAKMNAETQANHAAREQFVRQRVHEIEPLVPKLKLVWQGDLDQEVKLLVDGVDAQSKLNIDWPIDAGKHIVIVKRKGAADEMRTITLENGQTLDVDVTPPKNPASKIQTSMMTAKPGQTLVERKENPTNGWTQKNLGALYLGLAGASAISATAFAIKAAMYKDDVEKGCPREVDDFVCTPAGNAALREGYAWGRAATLTFAASGALAVVGAIEFWGRKKSKPVRSQKMQIRAGFGASQGFVSIEGRF